MTNPIELQDRFRKYARDELHCVDFGDSVFPKEVTTPIRRELNALLESKGMDAVDCLRQHSELMPSQLRRKGAENLFAQFEGLQDIDAQHVVVFPETSTALTKFGLLTIVEDAKKRTKNDKIAIIHSEGTFRYNFRIEDMVGGKLFTAPIDYSTGKITPATLEQTIQRAEREGYSVAGLVLETPNNPLMQVYSPDEMRNILKVTSKHQLYVVNDMFFSGTESPDIAPQQPLASIADDDQKQHILTISGVRRQLGLDNFAKAGFAASHNLDWIKKMEAKIKALHAFFPEGHFVILDHMLSKLGKDKAEWAQPWKRMHEVKRKATIQDLQRLPGITLIYPSDVGPYVNIGFTPEQKAKMLALGLQSDEHPDQIDNYKTATYFTIAGLDETLDGKHGVALMPLTSMGLKIEGFRVNALLSDEDRHAGIAAMQRALDSMDRGINYSDLEPKIRVANDNMERFFRERS